MNRFEVVEWGVNCVILFLNIGILLFFILFSYVKDWDVDLFCLVLRRLEVILLFGFYLIFLYGVMIEDMEIDLKNKG